MAAQRNMASGGLICSTCGIHLAPKNPEIAKILVKDFKGKWENVSPEDFHCKGCWSDDSEMWSPDCEIRKCCIKDKKFQYCFECQEFPCQKLQNWAKRSKKYEEALERLKKNKIERK